MQYGYFIITVSFFLVLISADPFICTVLMEIMVQPKQALVCEGTENFFANCMLTK